MKINSAILISFFVLLIGFSFDQSYLWIPFSVLVAGITDLLTRRWVTSDQFGSTRHLSALLKLFFALIGFYAMLGQAICIGLILWWLIN